MLAAPEARLWFQGVWGRSAGAASLAEGLFRAPGWAFSRQHLLRQPSPFSCPAMCPVDLVPFSGSLEEVGSRDLGGGLGSLAGVSGQ